MLPLQQAYEVKHSILEYLKATFSFKEKSVHEAFYTFINHPEEGIFKGSYISLKLPFVKSEDENEIPLEIKPNFPPYDHQYKAFKRLTTSDGHIPKSTLITTGTSSGKTECFLYPILDYCFKNKDRQGVKIIILYPMNALATDQAKRLAETIHEDERLKGKITAGLFIGEGKEKKKYPTEMGEDHIIENRQTIVDSPPDIILTNFKMLDYALMRNNYHNLWSFNLNDPSLLQYLVLDELHTYDGAQGTDVANLIRRLKLKLGIEKGHLCAVGTSATIGSGPDSRKSLLEYAEKVYGEEFEEDSLITENRLTVDEFFDEDKLLDRYIPRQIGLVDSRLSENETYPSYIERQKRLWQIPINTNEFQLGTELKKIKLVKDITLLTSLGIKSLQELIQGLADANEEFRRVAEWDNTNEFNPREEIINSILALISEAKSGEKKKFPFLFLQVQLWIRELSGVLRELGKEPKFVWKDSVDKKEPLAMPSYYCRECGSSGWLGVKDDNKNHFSQDTSQVYGYYFSNHKNTYLINTTDHKHVPEYEPNNTIDDYLNRFDLSLSNIEGEKSFKIQAVRKLKDTKSRHVCPECNTENTLGIIGTRIATLSSIAVSQVLASDLDPRREKYRKILAFTNSVQDAAHQAGFVEARNYRFTFRSSLQKVLNQINGPITLGDLQEEFIKYWKENADESGEKNEEAYYYRFLPADYKGKVDLASDFRAPGKKGFTEEFKKEFDHRMRWEVTSEFGYNALIGRTLEKSGASAVKFDEKRLTQVHGQIKKWLDQNNLATISEKDLTPFMNGILHRIRVRGCVDHIYFSKFRENKLELRELNWWQDPRHFLNRNFGTRTRLPKLITSTPHVKGMLDTTYSTTHSWYRNYFVKSFQLASDYPDLINEFYTQVLNALVDQNILNKVAGVTNTSYAISLDALIIENSVTKHECDKCSSSLFVARTDELTTGTRCLDYTCGSGFYRATASLRPNYYQLVYNRNRSPRIYAAEHTGILERKDREQKEIDFKERPRFNSLNAIVATSTLEMGIDIGTLNTAINNSIPPLTSNYLQRVGRAGRSTGSALIVSFAQSKPHDLFYFQEPSDMMEGEIATPACFLEAKDILFRHFFAFCLDKWSSANPTQNNIPSRLITLRLLTTDISTGDFFPNRIISFVKANETKLLDEFCSFYRSDLNDEKVLDSLREYLLEETFYIRLKRVFERLKSEYQYIYDKRKEIDDYIKTNKLGDSDEEKKVLDSEKKALWGLKRLLDKRALLEHLTNVGLLPNYAFPETGVTMNAWVKNIKAKGSNSMPSDHQYEIVRSANTAIRELAPDNFFYSQGFKFNISGLNTHDWGDAGTLIVQRFCSNCDHIDLKIKSSEPTCPKCGDSSWSSIRNEHTFVKLTSVKSVNTKDKATLDDRSDERDSGQYSISRHITFNQSTFQGAWGMKDIPFGIEYVKNVKITVANLGLSTSVDANKITINKIENIPYHGFVTCRHCGKSTSEPHKIKEKSGFHFGYCKHKNEEYKGLRDTVFEEVYLLREIETEAIKVLIPVQDVDGDSHVNMFKAGLELGLKKYYKGNPQHLSIIDYLEYNAQNSRFDRYLVIHDNISGGTGYLEKLFNPTEFTEVLRKAYHAIKECNCQHDGKDGCYRCIYTYSNQNNQKELSRSSAEKLFKKIVDKSDAWENYNTGLGKLSGNGQIEESELEDRFIRSLRNYVNKRELEGWCFEEELQDGVVNYKIRVINGGLSISYFIRPQFELRASDGVTFRTRTDFYITLTGITKDGISMSNIDDLTSTKDIAIYLDGYTYHATSENQRFINDLKKRESIAHSGSRISWTLTWNDIEKFDAVNEDDRKDTLAFGSTYSSTLKTVQKIPYWVKYSSDLTKSQNSLDRLIWILMNPLPDHQVNKKISLYLSTLQKNFAKPSIDEVDLNKYLTKNESIDENQMASNLSKGEYWVFPNVQIKEADFLTCKTVVRISDLDLRSQIFVRQDLKSIEKDPWEAFWQIYNLIQSNTKIQYDEFDAIEQSNDRYDCLDYHDSRLHSIIKSLIDNNIEFNREGGFFISFNGGFAECMLGFDDPKIAILPLSEEDEKILKENGFQIIAPEDFHLNLLTL
jgi:DEAD/DEAH box helicase domain-containing protein